MNLESGYLTAMRAEYQRLTGALPGEDSDIGIRMALLANQLELLEEELGALRQAADPETAEGEMLDRHADSRGLRRKEAAAAGGVLRDIQINEVPLIFRKEIYALACVFGGMVYGICQLAGMTGGTLQIVTAVSVIAARVVSVRFGFSLPSLKQAPGESAK